MEFKKIKEIIKQNGGIATTQELSEAGISRNQLKQCIDENILVLLERGLYSLPEEWEDEMYILQKKYSRGIFSHGTALFIHEMTNRTPVTFDMTFPLNYNVLSLAERNVKVWRVSEQYYDLGVEEKNTSYGRKIKVYNLERTLCDLVKKRNNCDIELINEAMKRYVLSSRCNIYELNMYAKKLKVEKQISNYVRILL